MNAKLRIKADSSKTNPKGMIWSAGIHHVFVDEKPARVYVPQYTVLDTFNKLTNQLKSEGSVKFGVDHLPDSLYKDNKILAKMKLDDVGEISRVVYDGESIYIDESHLTNKEIQTLHEAGELPAYSIVGAMEASPCPSERADYVVDNLSIDRVDFVEEGGCQECRTGVEPGEILITSKKSNMEAKSMSESKVEEIREGRTQITIGMDDDVQVLESTHRGEGFQEAIRYHDTMILHGMNIGPLLIGQDQSTGSYSQSKTQENVTFIYLDGLHEDIAGEFEKLFKQLCKINFGEPLPPHVSFEPFEEQDLLGLINALKPLIDNFTINPSEDWIRELIGKTVERYSDVVVPLEEEEPIGTGTVVPTPQEKSEPLPEEQAQMIEQVAEILPETPSGE